MDEEDVCVVYNVLNYIWEHRAEAPLSFRVGQLARYLNLDTGAVLACLLKYSGGCYYADASADYSRVTITQISNGVLAKLNSLEHHFLRKPRQE